MIIMMIIMMIITMNNPRPEKLSRGRGSKATRELASPLRTFDFNSEATNIYIYTPISISISISIPLSLSLYIYIYMVPGWLSGASRVASQRVSPEMPLNKHTMQCNFLISGWMIERFNDSLFPRLNDWEVILFQGWMFDWTNIQCNFLISMLKRIIFLFQGWMIERQSDADSDHYFNVERFTWMVQIHSDFDFQDSYITRCLISVSYEGGNRASI